MATSNVTATATQIIELGGAQKLADLGIKADCFGQWYAGNRREHEAVMNILAALTAPPASAPTRTNRYVEAAYRAGARHGVHGQVWDES